MRKARLLLLLVLCAALPERAFAQIDWVEWAQPGSGPGPYRGFGLFTRVFCVKEDGARHRVDTCIDDSDPSIKIVVDAQYGHMTDQNIRFNDPVAVLEPLNSASIDLNTFDFGYSYRLSPLLDVGVAIGSYTYSGEGFSTTSRLTLTPIRVSFVPLGFFQGDKGKKWGRVLRIKYINRRIVGDLAAGDFGSKGSYLVRGEFSQGISIGWDFYAFIAALRK
jgi:hypothetical protein